MPAQRRFRGSVAIRVLIATLLALAAVPLLGVGSAQACSCGALTDRQAAKGAVAVFTGTLVDTQLPPPAETRRSDDPVTYTFAVSRVYKGTATDSQRVRSIVGGEACGLELRGNGPFLIFATKQSEFLGGVAPGQSEDGLLAANLCGGTRPVKANEKLPFGKGKAPIAAASNSEPGTKLASEPTSSDDDPPGWVLPLGIIAVAVAAGLGVAAVDRRRKAT
ncbi:MAG: hypothetical protein ACT4P1_13305 [Sporichthyaceae bacterium]